MQASFAGQAAAADNFDELFVQMVRRILKLKQSFAISDGLTPRDVPGWDSVSNVDLLLESQRMFDVRLDIDAMAAIRSLGDLRAALKRQLPNAR
jgi:acyl carrier protein